MGRELINSFKDCYEYSIGEQQDVDIKLLHEFIPNCVSVRKTDTKTDKKGVDYIVTTSGGAEIYIDAKTRMPGASRYWKNGIPDLALEKYSVVEQKKVGWLFKKSDIHPDYILFTFDRSDTDKCFLIPFHLLKKACYQKGREWFLKYPYREQNNGTYKSSALYVPADVVIRAVNDAMILNSG